MSLKRNIVANYAGQVFVGIVGIAVVPIYLPIMGPEAYGLVGFFALMQAWSQLLDLGMSATMSRETARHRGGGLSGLALRQLLRSLEFVFLGMGLMLTIAVAVFAQFIATRWLEIRTLLPSEVELAIALMGFTVAARWVSGLYRGVLMGLERQVWLNAFTSVVIAIRFVGVIPILILLDAGPVCFFIFQALVSIFELQMLIKITYANVFIPDGAAVAPAWGRVKPLLKFSASVAFATVVWVLVTQVDKLIISTVLPLSDFGLFSAVVMIAGAVSMLSAAISQALLPRLTRLFQQGRASEFENLYRNATQWVTAIAGPMTLGLALFSEPVLWTWTGDRGFASAYAPVLTLYAIGNGFMALAVFPYYLQYARGDLRLHLLGNVLFAAVLVPAVWVGSSRFGALGAAWVWAVSNIAFFLLWTPWVHRQLMPGFHVNWFSRDVGMLLVLPILIGMLARTFQPPRMERIESALLISAVSAVMTVGALIASSSLRPMVIRFVFGSKRE